MIGRSARLPLGSPTMPVPPPTSAIGRVAQPLQPGHAHDRHEAADVERVGGGIEADVGRDRPLRAAAPPARAWRPARSRGRSSSSRRSVIGAYRTRWKRAPQPASLRAWPAGNPASCSAFGSPRAPAASFWSRSSRSSPSDSPSSTALWTPRLRREQLPLHRRAGRLRPQPGLQGLRGRRPAHHRPGARATHGRPAGRDVALREGGVHHDRGQAVLRAPRDRLVPGVRRHQEQHLQVPGGRRVLDHHHAAGPEPLARGHQRARQVAPAGSCARPTWPGRSRRKYPKDKILELYLNQIDLGNRRLRRRGGLPALLRQVGARPQRRRGGHAGRHPQGAVPLQPAAQPQPQRPAPQHGPEPAARQRAAVRRRRRAVEGVSAAALVPLRLQRRRRVLRRVRAAAARRPLRLATSTSRATGSTPRSTSTPSRPPSGRSRPGSRPSRAGPTGSSPGPATGSTSTPGPTRRTTAAAPRRPTCRAWWSRSTPRPATSARWWAAATSRTASSTAPPRRCASPAPPSSRSSTPPRSRRAIRSRT